jgi:hypothetical protein
MAGVRLMPLVLGVAACRAEADTGSATAPVAAPLAIPATWQAAPAIADAIKAGGVERSDAWAEPAMGCYAAWLVAGATKIEDVVAGVGSGAARDVVATADGATFSFERGGYRGNARATVAGEHTTVVACFWNDREPAACEKACAAVLGGAK